MTKDETNALKVIKKYKEEADHGNLEGAANAAIGAAKDLLTARGLLKTSEGLRKSAEKLTKTLNGKLTSEMAGKDLLAVKLKTANNKVERLIAEKETETGLKNQYRRWWEKRKNHDIRDMGTWKIIVHLFTKVKIGKKVDVKKK